ncbi:TetR/AcrR family transcriptional regulator [Nocardia sp. CA2R105]|uniref:TetR/AcrR family transcriptional regulator n=1 Tax=Nocardia coffeae TaxID=2873381 RepID=UPI001CA79153|nr:TetR/AcrR family transcriptional regulator [Nocardia coffeae]MBY8862966.1 TetR/AcrR family transcriptional regulator [Nocardia coffeae]
MTGPLARTQCTRELLIVTAERLFANLGFDAVSLRVIAAAAGSSNTGVARNYFGDKESLARAVFELRAPELNARREELLDGVASRPDRLRGLLEALIRPLAEQIGVNNYVGYLASLQADHGRTIPVDSESVSCRRARHELERALRLSPNIFRRRFRLVIRLAVSALADHERSGRRRPHELEDLIADLIDAAAGLLTAPDTRAAPDVSVAHSAGR